MVHKEISWPVPESEMGELIHVKDWSKTSLGEIREWPKTLLSSLNICLSSDSPAGICWGDNLLFFYNDAWINLLGDKHPSSLGQPFSKIFEGHWQNLNSNVKQVLSTGEVVKSRDQHFSFTGGEEKILDFSFSPIPDEDGSIGGVFLTTVETPEFQQEELNDFFENADIGIHWVRSDGTIKRANQAELDMLGYSREEYIDHHIADFHVDDEVIDDILTKLTNREELHNYKARLRCKDGTLKHVLISSSVYEKDGEFIHTRCITRDITEREKARQALREKGNQISSQVSDMKRLHELSMRLQEQDDVKTTMQEVMEAAAELMNADKASVQIYDKQEDVLKLASTIGYGEEFKERFGIVGADDITSCASALKNHEQVLVEDFGKTDKFPEFGKIAESYGMNAVLSTPLFSSDDRFLGMFSMYWENPHRPDEEKFQLLDLYTQQAARQIERREAEQILRRSEERYRTLFETMDEGFCILKIKFDENDKPVDWRYLKTNSAFEEHTGLKDIEGDLASEVMPDLEEHWFEKYGNVALTGEPVYFEDYTSELERWFEISAFRIGDPSERKIAVLFNNMTERKQAQEDRKQLLREVKNERQRLSEIFQQAPSFMSIVRGPDHVFERVNDYYRKLVGDRELIGRPVAEAIPEAKEQGLIELLDEVYKSGEPFRGKEMGIELQRKPDQPAEKLYLDFVYQPLRDHEGSITGIFVQGVDLTERHHAKEKLESMNETLEERVEKRTKKLRSYQKQLRSLAAELNKAEEQERQRLASELHDKLGQILTVAKMRVDGLQNHELSEQLSTDVKELKEIMDDALDYNRDLMSELKPPPALDKEDVREVVYWTANKMEKHGIDIIIEDDDQPKPVKKEIRTIIHQSVRELLFNVVKHGEVDTARLSMWRSNNQVRVTVEDEGKGFEPGEEKSIPVEEGFGLFNINERLEWHGGAFEIDSEPGKGTKATICAPLKEIEKSDESEDADEEPLPPSVKEVVQAELWQKVKVLLVDDHDMVRRGLRQMIEEQDDMEIAAEAADGQEAIELARETSPDIIVMDVNMPVLDGIEATQKIKAEMPNIRIIGLSLHDREEVKQDMRSAGASDYLTKDEAFETLCATIRNEPTAAK